MREYIANSDVRYHTIAKISYHNVIFQINDINISILPHVITFSTLHVIAKCYNFIRKVVVCHTSLVYNSPQTLYKHTTSSSIL